jgi:hypothetical protein
MVDLRHSARVSLDLMPYVAKRESCQMSHFPRRIVTVVFSAMLLLAFFVVDNSRAFAAIRYTGRTAQNQAFTLYATNGTITGISFHINDTCPDGHILAVDVGSHFFPAITVDGSGGFGASDHPPNAPDQATTIRGRIGSGVATGSISDTSLSIREQALCHGGTTFSASRVSVLPPFKVGLLTRTVPNRPHTLDLIRVVFYGIRPGTEGINWVCDSCTVNGFQNRLGSSRGTYTLGTTGPIHLTSRSHFRFAISSAVAVGRFRSYGFDPTARRLRLLSQGCVKPATFTVRYNRLVQVACP